MHHLCPHTFGKHLGGEGRGGEREGGEGRGREGRGREGGREGGRREGGGGEREGDREGAHDVLNSAKTLFTRVARSVRTYGSGGFLRSASKSAHVRGGEGEVEQHH